VEAGRVVSVRQSSPPHHRTSNKWPRCRVDLTSDPESNPRVRKPSSVETRVDCGNLQGFRDRRSDCGNSRVSLDGGEPSGLQPSRILTSRVPWVSSTTEFSWFSAIQSGTPRYPASYRIRRSRRRRTGGRQRFTFAAFARSSSTRALDERSSRRSTEDCDGGYMHPGKFPQGRLCRVGSTPQVPTGGWIRLPPRNRKLRV
jgi:hypothetical protein